MSPRILPVVLFALVSSVAPVLTGCSSDTPAEMPGTVSPMEKLRALERTHVLVIITANNRVKLNGSRVSPDEIPAEFSALGKKQPGRPVALLMQEGTNPDAADFVRVHAAKAGLGPVELVPLY